jgi:adenine phosphoribosyltransferase
MKADFANNRHNSGLVDRQSFLKAHIRDVPDFPKEGILFKDISPLLRNPHAFASAITDMADNVNQFGRVDALASIDARGFFFGAAIALHTKIGIIPVRKPGKLPGDLVMVCSVNEYALADLCIQKDSIKEGERVIIVDDVLATGGTIHTVASILEKNGVTVLGAIVLLELSDLGGRNTVKIPVYSVLKY